ncbi:ankyrin repeat domain-containing protein [bacterium]|nr:ankyrin repeat domain-containing protein [bacterium]
MKHLLLTTIAAVVLVGCGNPEADHALLDAAEGGYIEEVKQAIAEGADVNAKDGYRPVHKLGLTPLNFAAMFGHTEIAELLIDKGADANAKDEKFGLTPLHNAAESGRKEIAELLISKGADVNAKDTGGETPLDRAIKSKQTKTANLLRKHGGKTGEELKAEGK